VGRKGDSYLKIKSLYRCMLYCRPFDIFFPFWGCFRRVPTVKSVRTIILYYVPWRVPRHTHPLTGISKMFCILLMVYTRRGGEGWCGGGIFTRCVYSQVYLYTYYILLNIIPLVYAYVTYYIIYNIYSIYYILYR